MNNITIIGNLTRDPELRTTQSGVTVCNFSVAVNRRRHRGQDGEQETDFFNVTVWREMGEACAKYLAKGRKVAVSGEMQSRKYTGQDGAERTVWNIIAQDVEFLTPRGQQEDAPAQGYAQGYAQPARQNPPRRQDAKAMAQEMAQDAGADFIEIDDSDELPF